MVASIRLFKIRKIPLKAALRILMANCRPRIRSCPFQRPSASETRHTLPLLQRNPAWFVSAPPVTPIILSLRSPVHLGAKSVTNSRFLCVATITTTCIVTATSSRGGPIFRLVRSRWRETSGTKPCVVRPCRSFATYRLPTQKGASRINDGEASKQLAHERLLRGTGAAHLAAELQGDPALCGLALYDTPFYLLPGRDRLVGRSP